MENIKTRPCPICKKVRVEKGAPQWPFCSERCKLLDLGKWASGQYAIPGDPVAKEQEGEAKKEETENDLD